MAKIVSSFENIYKKYNKVLSIKELAEMSNQLIENGYEITVKRDNPSIGEAKGFFEKYKRKSAMRRDNGLSLSPAQNYMYQ